MRSCLGQQRTRRRIEARKVRLEGALITSGRARCRPRKVPSLSLLRGRCNRGLVACRHAEHSRAARFRQEGGRTAQEESPAKRPNKRLAHRHFFGGSRVLDAVGLAGLCGATYEHQNIMLDDEGNTQLLHCAATRLAAPSAPIWDEQTGADRRFDIRRGRCHRDGPTSNDPFPRFPLMPLGIRLCFPASDARCFFPTRTCLPASTATQSQCRPKARPAARYIS